MTESAARGDTRGAHWVVHAPRWTRSVAVRRAWPVLRVVLGFALAGLALWVVYGRGGELQASRPSHLHWVWLLPALVVEALSLVSFGFMQRRLLKTGGVTAPTGPIVGLSLASQAISNSLPGGPALAAAYSFRWYRRFGADDALAGWTLIGALIGASLSLALGAAAGVALAADAGADEGLIPVVVGVLALSVGMAVLFVKQEWVLSVLTRLVARRRWHHDPADGDGPARRDGSRERRRRSDLTGRVMRLFERLGEFELGWRGLVQVTAWGGGTWLFDCACFVLAFKAVGAPIPWGALLLAYGAGQLAANLPITPGGLGAVEGSIQLALVEFGGATSPSAQAAAVAAVFVYRLISFWLELLVGWSAAGVLALGVRRGRFPREVTHPAGTTEAEPDAGAAQVAGDGAGAEAGPAADRGQQAETGRAVGSR